MKSASDLYKKLATSNAREFETKISINNVDYMNEITSFDIQGSLSESQSDIVIGSTPCMRLNIELTGTIRTSTKAEIKPSVRFIDDDGSVTEWLQLGVFYGENPTYENNKTSIVAYDMMLDLDVDFVSVINYPCQLQELQDEILDSFNMHSSFIPKDITIYYQPIGYTARELLGYIASIHGGNAIIDNRGKFDVSYYRVADTINLKNCINQTIDKETFNLTKVSCVQDESNPIVTGSGEEFNTLAFVNPFVSKTIIDDIGNELIGVKCNNVALTMQGSGLYYLGERIQTIDNTDKSTIVYLIVSSIELNFSNGSFTEKINSTVRTKSDNSYTKSSDLQKTANNISKQLTEYIYSYSNDSGISIGSSDIDIITIKFSTSYASSPIFFGYINMNVLTAGTFKFKYYVGSDIQLVTPSVNLAAGFQIVNLMLPLEFDANVSKIFKVVVSSDNGGTATINMYQIQSLLKGQGLSAVGSKWDGMLEFEITFEEIEPETKDDIIVDFGGSIDYELNVKNYNVVATNNLVSLSINPQLNDDISMDSLEFDYNESLSTKEES